jgi:ESCRT-II complex subunit VPS25
MAGGKTVDEFPWQHSFPPFYTLQPHQETQRKQIDAWRSVVLGMCKTVRKLYDS